jgi:hypothetical protein
MGRAVAELGILADEQIREKLSISKSFNPRMPMTAYDHTITIVAVLELSGRSWLLGAVASGVDRLLVRYGIESFKPRLKNAEQKLAELKTADGRELPPNTMSSIERLLQHRFLSQQLKEIEAARQQVATKADPDPVGRKIQLLFSVFDLGVETATVLAQEVFARSFKDRRALAAFVGISGTPYDSGGWRRKQGISKSGNSCVRRLLGQLAWRWPKFQTGKWPRQMVSRTRQRRQRADQEDHDCGARPQIARRPLALRRDRRNPRRSEIRDVSRSLCR